VQLLVCWYPTANDNVLLSKHIYVGCKVLCQHLCQKSVYTGVKFFETQRSRPIIVLLYFWCRPLGAAWMPLVSTPLFDIKVNLAYFHCELSAHCMLCMKWPKWMQPSFINKVSSHVGLTANYLWFWVILYNLYYVVSVIFPNGQVTVQKNIWYQRTSNTHTQQSVKIR